MERIIEWAVVVLAFAATVTLAVYAGAVFLIWDITPFSLGVARGVFLISLVLGVGAAIDVECKRKKREEKRG